MTTSAKPGLPVRGSESGRPIMAAMDLLGRRWALRIIWELREGPEGFRPLRKRCDSMSSSVLRVRLAELEDAALVERTRDTDYALTEMGSNLIRAIRPLSAWANKWADSVDDSNDSAAERPDQHKGK